MLADRFARIDAKFVRKVLEEEASQAERLSPTMKRLTAEQDLPNMIAVLFPQEGKIDANRHLRS
jgi:hypothetical protein